LAGLPHPHARFALPLKCMTRSSCGVSTGCSG
jgi:hypothetical protein